MPNEILFYVGGFVAGTIGTLVSQPFDTCKIHLQAGKSMEFNKRSFLQNIKWAYKGTMPSIIGYSIEKCLVFGTYTTVYSHTSQFYTGIFNNIFAGFISGLIASLSIAPFEQIKIDRQLHNKTIISSEHLFKGLKYTAARESIGFSIYFSTYELLKKNFLSNHENYYFLKIGLFGALSAFISWIPIYPLDMNKTKIQSGKNNQFFYELKSQNSIKHKIKFLYNGYHFAMLRAIPFHSTCFVCYEIIGSFAIQSDVVPKN